MGSRGPDDTSDLGTAAARAEGERQRLEAANQLLEIRIAEVEALGQASEAYNIQEEIAANKRKLATIAQTELVNELIKANQKLAELKINGHAVEAAAQEEFIAAAKERLAAAAKERVEEEEHQKRVKELSGDFDNLFSFFTKKPKESAFTNLFSKKGRAANADTLKGIRAKATGMNLLGNGLTAVVEMSVAMAVAQDAATVAFNKSTGVAGEYNSEIRQVNASLINAGVTASEAAATFGDLYKTVSDFTRVSREDQVVIAKTTALLNELGVSSGLVAKNIQFATKALGMNLVAAAELQTGLRSLANELGLSADQVAQDFGIASNVLAAFADGTGRATEAFAMLEAQTKATGLSMQKLIAITGKFDTFDSAAQQVGKLNAMLGGPFLSTLQMIETTDPAERMRMLSGALTDAGLSFNDMAYYEKKAIADAAGLADVNDLALLLSGNLESLAPPQMDAQSIIEMKNQTAEFNTVAEEMKQAMMSLAISLGPVVTILKMLLDGLQLLLTPIRWIGEGIEYMSDALDGMGTSGTTALNILKMLGAAAVAVGITMALVSAPLWGTYAAIAAIVTAMGAFVKGVTVGFSPSLLDTLDMSAIGFGTLSVEAGLASTELDAVTASTKQVATQGAPAARATAATTQ